ncbi:E3 ubiquitin-protein ligase MIB2 [Euwallacea fornicatus]|uniref:E3 ubiquitin-protein ligase MIB2 n=1 Tax=Euwallacea fornicatus TaxID=995702 RepID=UPI00338E0B99
MLAPGLRIVRGPDWSWGNQDGGEGFVGTVCEIGQGGKSGAIGSPDKTVVVQWDNGTRTNYRVGYLGKYDLRIIDNAQIGVKHTNIVCDACKSPGINGMRYKCTVCHDFDLCYMCYHRDEHDQTHRFKRFDSVNASGVDLPPRQGETKSMLYGIFADAKVIRGYNWEWGNQDGGEGKVGRVVDVRGWDNESNRSVVNVHWLSGSRNVYRLGHKGICDIKCVEPSSGGTYYPEHLPVLGQNVELAVSKPIRCGPLPFTVGDRVQVSVSVDQLKLMQQGHGGWNPRMADYVEKLGIVHRVTDKGDIRVNFDGCSNRWTLNPSSLTKIDKLNVGDVVTLITEAEKVKELQRGHGEWIEIMRNSLGKLGKILKIYSDGDLRVQLDGQVWTLNPQCVRTVPGSAAELANTMHAVQNQRKDPSIHWHSAIQVRGGKETLINPSVSDALIRTAALGRLEMVQRLLEMPPHLSVDVRSNGKTALQVASHQGHIPVVRLLLRAGASVNAMDSDGDTCLHYAAFGNQPEVLDILIKSGADINATNRSGCTALQVSAHKQPARCAQLLLVAGADPNSMDLYGDTALHDAIGKDTLSVIELLCATAGVDFTLRNKRGFNVLHHAALKGKNVATRRLLQHARQLVDVKKEDGFSALHLAALNGHKDVVETLIRIGQAEIDLINNRDQTALLLAVSQGHCDVIELLITLGASINATDEEGNSALHIILFKRNQLSADIKVDASQSPEIHSILQKLEVTEHHLAIAIAGFLIKKGVDTEIVNTKGHTAFDILECPPLQEVLKTFSPATHDNNEVSQELRNIEDLAINEAAVDNYNLTEDVPKNQPEIENAMGARSRKSELLVDVGSSSQNNSPSHKIHIYQNEDLLSNSKECLVCSDITEENVTLFPCEHKPACEDCSMRMKKCLVCSEFVQKRVAKDGRTVAGKSRQPSAERLKYLETKIAEIEESHACSICMERKRNVVFLCGHGTCDRCADTLRTCHMCRKTITKKIPIY